MDKKTLRDEIRRELLKELDPQYSAQIDKAAWNDFRKKNFDSRVREFCDEIRPDALMDAFNKIVKVCLGSRSTRHIHGIYTDFPSETAEIYEELIGIIEDYREREITDE